MNDCKEWILTNDKKPTISKELVNDGFTRIAVLITDTDYDMVKLAWYDIEDDKFYDEYHCLSLEFENVVAWMPLPKKYKY